LKYHKQLIALRKQYASLRTGAYELLYADENVYVFARILGDEEIIIAVNIDNASAQVNFPVTQLKSCPEKILYGEVQIAWSDREGKSYLELTLPNRSGCIFC
ncbi:MAG: alpha-glucosidase C-terminal domain-containing protein, partial [Xenococcaceae cyanobacterium]